jgi:hypothetical protein
MVLLRECFKGLHCDPNRPPSSSILGRTSLICGFQSPPRSLRAAHRKLGDLGGDAGSLRLFKHPLRLLRSIPYSTLLI